MKVTRMLAICSAYVMLSACSTVGYYSQIVTGHMKIVLGKQSVETVLADQSLDEQTRHRLQVAVDARRYAISRLQLPENDSYSSYYDTGQNFVTWNVVAAPEFSLKAKTWCFPVAGCVSYRVCGPAVEHHAEPQRCLDNQPHISRACSPATVYP